MRRLLAIGATLAALALGACDGGGVQGTDDARTDAGEPDAPVDAPVDVPRDADADAPVDAAVDAPIDAAVELACTACHGDPTTAAPPADTTGGTASTRRGVGAHRAHLTTGAWWHHDVACDDCHVVPPTVDSLGHVDTALPAELTWSPLARADGATPSFDGARCSGTYCHGATLVGGTTPAPVWTDVGSGQAACGGCHGLPPPAPHPAATRCNGCHPSVDIGTPFAAPQNHIDGVVQVNALACDSCHGGAGDPSPPRDVGGNLVTAARGVGAHRSHLRTSTWRAAIACSECHQVPAAITAPGHVDSALPAELTFGPLARTDGASPSFDGTSCNGSYCHGATLLPGGSDTTPSWTTVDGTQAACGTCHGLPPGGTHPPVTGAAPAACATCHPAVIAVDGSFANPALHIDGVVEVAAASCDACHGSTVNPAPPRGVSGELVTTSRAVGAHQPHLAPSTWHAPVACAECHRVPVSTTTPGHVDSPLPAELTFGPLATAGGASPSFDGTACSGAYCHGATLAPGGTDTTPTWTTVDGSQDACGTCHGLPPGGTHPPVTGPPPTSCAACHGDVIAANGTFANPALHIDGTVEVSAITCTTCHGSAGDPSPPRDTLGNNVTTARGVGAHRSHLRAAGWRAAITCTECHQVPATATSVGHTDTPLPAELTFGPLARADGAAPTWNGIACSGAYCHGATLEPGGINHTPTWTTVNGTQAACGTCHGLPPGGAHPPVTGAAPASCSVCHPQVIAPDGSWANPALHVDGVVEATAQTCDSCHGSNLNPAPPRGVQGELATTTRAVGAHQQHLGAAAWHAPIGCSECHRVPATTGAPGHVDSPLPAELTFGPLATADGAAPTFNGASCSGAYCHGATLMPGGSDTTPTWTTVDGSQDACGTCHGLPPGGTHPTVTGMPPASCSTCHGEVVAADGTWANPALHVDGTVEVTPLTCTSCHGSGAQPAPPLDTTGASATTARGVGAHRSHLRATAWHAPVACSECHRVPATIAALGHTDTPLPAELTFGPLATTGGATPSWNGTTCAGAYCHGATLMPGGSDTTPTWTTVDGTQAACGTCHGLPPGGNHPTVTGQVPAACATCHDQTLAADGSFANPALHVDGVVQVRNLTCDACHGSNGDPSPPRDLSGNLVTTARGVGAHRSHLRTASWRAAIACAECHRVPGAVGDVGHLDTPRPAELTFGPTARADGAVPSFDGARCSGAYCHGATLLPGGSNHAPAWTTVDGTQAACGTCHGLPPGGAHPPVGAPVPQACGMCHPAVMSMAGAFVGPALHVDGVVEATAVHPGGWAAGAAHGAAANDGGLASCQTCHGANLDGGMAAVSCNSCHAGWQTRCTFCHGGVDNQTGAPPAGVGGELLRATVAVGAHTLHVNATTIHAAWDCGQCHIKPTSALSAGHIDGDGRAEVRFGALNPIATYATATTTCGSMHCHGNGRTDGGAAVWTTDPVVTCASCHHDQTVPSGSFSMSGDHRPHVKEKGIACRECHATVVDVSNAIIGLALHVDGINQVSLRQGGSWNATTRGCDPACHGLETW